MKRVTLATLALTAACASTVTAPPTVTESVPAFERGALVVGIGSHGSSDEATHVRGLAMRHVRVTYYVENDSEHARLLFRLRLEDLRAHGLEVLVVVHDFAPRTAAPDIMASLARSFPGTLWQVGNEWDWNGYSGTDYAKLMQRVLPAIRSSDSSARVIGMGLATTDGQKWAVSRDDVRLASFTRDYLQAGGPMLEAWAIHAYGMGLAAAVRARALATERELQHRMPLWVTEVGADRDGMQSAWGKLSAVAVDTLQARESVQALAAAQSAGVARLYFYQLWTGDDDGFGFLRRDARTERPIVATIRQQLR